MNVDGAFDHGRARIGAVVRDNVGDLIASMAEPVKHIKDPTHLEAMAVAKGLELARDLAITEFSIESDCMQVVDSINSQTEDFSTIGHILQMIKHSARRPDCIGIFHTIREANIPAHNLAKHACAIDQLCVWIKEGPNCIHSAILAYSI